MEVVLVGDEGVFGVVLKRLGHAALVRFYVDGLMVEAYLDGEEFEDYDL